MDGSIEANDFLDPKKVEDLFIIKLDKQDKGYCKR